MVKGRKCFKITLLALIFLFILLVNFYFFNIILNEHAISSRTDTQGIVDRRRPETQYNPSNEVKLFQGAKIKGKERKYYTLEKNQPFATVKAARKIKRVAAEIRFIYKNVSDEYPNIVNHVLNELKSTQNDTSELWKTVESWVTGTQVLPHKVPLLGTILHSLCSKKVVKADNSKKGTQLKLHLTLEGGQQAVFKPQWYSRSEIIKGPVYAGKDRHNAEVAAFHLSLLLNIRRVPLAVGRKVNLQREIIPVASTQLLNTFYQDGNNTCFYGKCLYCEPKSSICTSTGLIEGALILWLPKKIKFEKHSNPWQRTYKKDLIARWEIEENYCDNLKRSKQYNPQFNSRLLDLIDSVVFDFLLDNGDRHHYEVPQGLNSSSVFLFDNGKSFGNPYIDHLDILAPLYQCCIIRNTTVKRLKIFSGGTLSASLEKILKFSHISPVLTYPHLLALDRRLIFIFATIEICIREKGASRVLL